MFVKMYFVLLIGLFTNVQGLNLRHNCTTNTTLAPIDRNLEQCLKESGANPSYVESLRKGNYNRSNIDLKKWAFCYLVKNGVMSTSGVLRQHMVLKNVPEEDQNNVETTINKCLYDKAHDPVETAWHYLTCFRAKHPQLAKEANRI